MVVSQNLGYLSGVPHNKDYSILGCILGVPYFGQLPHGDYIPLLPANNQEVFGFFVFLLPPDFSLSFSHPLMFLLASYGSGWINSRMIFYLLVTSA